MNKRPPGKSDDRLPTMTSDRPGTLGIQEEKVVFPEFSTIDAVFDDVKSEKKPIIVVIMGTKWSPPCRYTFVTAMEIMKEEKYQNLVQMMYIDQDADLHFCYSENIPVGFPTLLVFVNTYLVPFLEEGQSFDPTKSDQKNRLIRQLNMKQLRAVLDGAIDVYEEKAMTIPCSIL